MLDVLTQLFKFMIVYRKFWMAPIIIGLLVLGGDFWDKLRSLFVHGARARFPEAAG